MADVLTPEQRKKNMRSIRSKDTNIECILRKALWKKGYRYRKNYKKLPGKPDIVLTKYRIAIFCDSEFFHGKDWGEQRQRILKGEQGEFWDKKISGNIQHDEEINRQLKGLGWTVLRFWGNDIKRNLSICIQIIEETILDTLLESEEK